MANFSPPFSKLTDHRVPTTDERNNGFSCGPADRRLFNGLFFRIESELASVISAAGITPSDDDMSQLLKAIKNLIDAATGGGDPDQFLLLAQATARLPIYPNVDTLDGRFNVSSPSSGTIRLGGNVNFLHRGISPHTSTQQDFATTANKIYHLRWNPTTGFELKDLVDPAYNSGALSETNGKFDSSYDDMLVARVITNASNVATITTLANRDRLGMDVYRDYALCPHQGGLNIPAVYAWALERMPINFARTPKFFLHGFEESLLLPHANDSTETNIFVREVNRYEATIFAWMFSPIGNTPSTPNIQSGRPRYNGTFMPLGG